MPSLSESWIDRIAKNDTIMPPCHSLIDQVSKALLAVFFAVKIEFKRVLDRQIRRNDVLALRQHRFDADARNEFFVQLCVCATCQTINEADKRPVMVRIVPMGV